MTSNNGSFVLYISENHANVVRGTAYAECVYTDAVTTGRPKSFMTTNNGSYVLMF